MKPGIPHNNNNYRQNPKGHRGTMPPRLNPQFHQQKQHNRNQHQIRKGYPPSNPQHQRNKQFNPQQFQSNKTPYNNQLPNQSFSSQKNRHPSIVQYQQGFVNQARRMPPGNPRPNMQRPKAHTTQNNPNQRFIKSNSNPMATNPRNPAQRPNFAKMKSNGKIKYFFL